MSTNASCLPELTSQDVSLSASRPPELSNQDVARVVCKYFNFTSVHEDTIKRLPSYEDKNFYFVGSSDTVKNGEFIFKMSNPQGILVEELQGINNLMKHLKSCGLSLVCPLASRMGSDIIPLSRQELIGEVLNEVQSHTPTEQEVVEQNMDDNNESAQLVSSCNPTDEITYYLRVLTFVPGKVFHYLEKTSLVPSLLYECGEMLGKMDKELMENFSNEALARRQLREWDLKYFIENTRKKTIHLSHHKSEVEKVIKKFEEVVSPRLTSFRESIIHFDANGLNTVVENKCSNENTYIFKSFIDFGDCIKTCTVFDLAICLCYMMLYNLKPVTCSNSVELVGPIISGYNSVLPLSEEELDCLYYLVLARCCISGVNGEICYKAEPWNDYFLMSAECWLLMEELLTISKEEVDRVWRKYLFWQPVGTKTLNYIDDSH